MSELKVHRFITTDELFPEANAGVLYYEKSEADKVIAELKTNLSEIQSQKMQLEDDVALLRHDLEEERRWRKCCEGLPLKGQRVLFLAKYKTDKVREWIGDFRHVDGIKEDFAVFYASAPGWGCEFLIDEVIGWMPLPSHPKEEK